MIDVLLCFQYGDIMCSVAGTERRREVVLD